MKTLAKKSAQSNRSNISASPKTGGITFFAPAIQPKLKVSQPGDKHEQEADTMADKVMRMPEPEKKPTLQRKETDEVQKMTANEQKMQTKSDDKTDDKLQRKETDEVQKMTANEQKMQTKANDKTDDKLQRKETDEVQKMTANEQKMQTKANDKTDDKLQRKETGGNTTAPADTHTAITQKTGGNPLGADTKQFMESRFGADFGKVRIHADSESAQLNNQVGAKAFTYQNHVFFGKDQYQPANSDGKQLLAHELTHVIQQGQAVHRKAKTSGSGAVGRAATTAFKALPAAPQIQRLGLSDALDYFADKAYNIPGYRMFTIVIGVNPINMQAADRSAANILRAIVEFLPGGHLITQVLDKYNVFEKAGAFVESQLQTLGITGSLIRNAIMQFLDSLSWRDIFHLGSVWERAKRIFTEPIGRIIQFAKSLFGAILQIVRNAVLRPIAALAEGTRGYDLIKAILGQDPITGDPYPRTAETLIGGFMKLIGQEEVWENIKKGNAIARAWAWFQGALSGLMGFVRQIPSLFIKTLQSLELQDFLILPRAFAKILGAFGNFAGRFISWATNTVIDLLEILFSVVAPGVVPYIKKAKGAFQTILRNPIGFVSNLVKAAKLGFQQFSGNIITHLKNSLLNWLLGSLAGAGIYIPKAFSFIEIIKFVLSVLGLTWQNIRKKLLRFIPEPALQMLETGLEVIKLLVTEGPAAAWQKIKEEVGDLQQMIIQEVISFVTTKIVQVAVVKLISMLNPAGAVIQAILAIYDTIMFVVEKIKEIGRVAAAIIDSIAAIAAGTIAPAAKKVETTLAGMLTLAINFLAKFAKLDKVSTAIMKVVNKIRQPIDKALDKVVTWLLTMAKKALGAFTGKGKKDKPDTRTDAQKETALKAGVQEGEALLQNEDTTPEEVSKKLPAIQKKYQLTQLKLVKANETETDETDYIYGEVNPNKKGNSVSKKRYKYLVQTGNKLELKPKFQTKEFTRDKCYGKGYRKGVYKWKKTVMSTVFDGKNPDKGIRSPNNKNKYWSLGKYWDNSGNTIASIDHKPSVVDHWNDIGRKTDQKTRKDYFNADGGQVTLYIVPLSQNSSDGASAKTNYKYTVTKTFKGPDDKQ